VKKFILSNQTEFIKKKLELKLLYLTVGLLSIVELKSTNGGKN